MQCRMFQTRLQHCCNFFLMLSCVALVPVAGRADEAAADGVSKSLAAMSLPDSYGKTRELSEFRKSDVLVFVFLGTECPLAKLYAPRLQKIADRFSDKSVSIVGVCSNVQDSLTEISAYANRAGVRFPMLVDNEQKLADLLEATRTPEAIVLNREGVVLYRGRIDDQYAISVAKRSPSREDLVLAIESSLKGEAPAPDRTPAPGCVIGRRSKVEPHGDITWSSHVAGIFFRRCAECHRDGEIAPFSLTSYQDVMGWEATIAEVVDEGRMPPWNANPEIGHFKNDARLSEDEKRTIREWIRNGCPEGNPSEVPPLPSFTAGWRMPEPDQIIHVSEKPFKVPATGTVEYQYIPAELNFTEDKYIVAAEARPGNPAVVHHIIAFLQMPGDNDVSLGRMLIGYAPGTSPLIFPEGSAMKVPAGSKILFEIHYTPNGVEQEDRSYIGIKFADPATVKNEVVGIEALNGEFRIPPGEAAHQVVAQKRLREDLDVLSLTPHMHVRGKSFRYEAIFPDGKTETLLDVPRYDFNWQLRYEFSEPKRLPKGTVVKCTATYDNSSENPNNPDPSKEVTWGQQSWEEMMIGFITAVKPGETPK